MSAGYLYDYYIVKVPGDLYPLTPEEEWVKNTGSVAIDEAREKAVLYCIPAEWSSRLLWGKPGDFEVTFKVRRKRFRVSYIKTKKR